MNGKRPLFKLALVLVAASLASGQESAGEPAMAAPLDGANGLNLPVDTSASHVITDDVGRLDPNLSGLGAVNNEAGEINIAIVSA